MVKTEKSIQKSIKDYQDILRSSPTAYSPGAKPTSGDIAAQRGLMVAQKAGEKEESAALKERWYGDQSQEDKLPSKPGLLQKALHLLGTPMYGVVGAIEAALGKGTKKGLVENIKANVEEEGCYDDQTEILTNCGWKFFKDVISSDKIATLNQSTGELEYQNPLMIVKYDNKNELIRIDNRAIDIAVTANHNMYVSTLTMIDKKNVYNPYKMIKAIDLPNTHIKIKRNCKWRAADNNEYPKNWFAIMGLYLSEGCMANHGTAIHLSVHKKDIVEKTKKMLDESGFKYSLRKSGGFDVFIGKDRAIELKKLGTASQKYIPNYIKFSSASNIKIFLEWFSCGDAHEKNGAREFYSSSKKLIDDLQECLIKIGNNGNINIRDRRGRKVFISGHWANCNYLSYELNERVKKTESYIRGHKDIYKEKYNGIVYCVEVPNHVLLVRRNGKPYFCGNTMGDLVRSYGVNNLVAMPLGFALEMALDPVNWATLGTSSLVPRIAKGLVKSGGVAAAAGAKSNVLGTAKSIVGISKAVAEKSGVKSKKLDKLYSDLSGSVDESTKVYEALTGDTVESFLKKSVEQKRVLEKAYDKLEQSSLGRALNKLGVYSSRRDITTKVKAKEVALAEESVALAASTAKDAPIEKTVKGIPDIFKNKIEKAIDSKNVSARMAIEKDEVAALKKNITEKLQYMKDLVKDPNIIKKVEGLTELERDKMVELFKYYEADFAKYDKQIAKILMSSPWARKILNSYATITGIFKTAKVGLGMPVSAVNSVVGNAIMTGMIGVNIANDKFLKAMGSAKNIYFGDKSALKEILSDKKLMSMINKFPELWKEQTGLDAESIQLGQQYLDDLVEQLRKEKRFTAKAKRDIAELREDFDAAFSVVNTRAGAAPTALITEEFMRGPYKEWLNKLKLRSESGNTFADNLAGTMFWASTKSMDIYSKFDQSYRLGLIMHLSQNGITQSELRTIARRIPIGLSDIEKAGKNLYKIDPLKALEISSETYMNYLAMPSFVKIMRTLPLIGSPFVSFTYGATSNVAKTGLYNTSFFNKVQFALKEISGQKSPLEKEGLEGPYYSYLNKPGMVKLPFFQDTPVYLNMANMLPYYTMNLMAPPQREYKNKYAGAVSDLIDKSPFFKTPDGQMMMDYFIMPMMLQGETPQGMFGQELYPKDASLIEKALSLGLTAAEVPMPSTLGVAGLAIPEPLLKYTPLYKARKLGYAREGKTSLGISGTEPKTERVLKALSGLAGLPMYSMNLQMTAPKKKIK